VEFPRFRIHDLAHCLRLAKQLTLFLIILGRHLSLLLRSWHRSRRGARSRSSRAPRISTTSSTASHRNEVTSLRLLRHSAGRRELNLELIKIANPCKLRDVGKNLPKIKLHKERGVGLHSAENLFPQICHR